MKIWLSAGLDASSVVKNVQATESSRLACRVLHIETGNKVMQIDRLRLGNGEPVAYRQHLASYFIWTASQYPDDLSDSTIFRILEEKYEIPVIRGCYRMSAMNAEFNT
jgi:GntR family transcriptional regulator